jgi:hypothetical protein
MPYHLRYTNKMRNSINYKYQILLNCVNVRITTKN